MKPTDFRTCRICSLPCAVRCSECHAVLDDGAAKCPGCGVAFCETEQQWLAGDPHRVGMAVCRLHAMSDSAN